MKRTRAGPAAITAKRFDNFGLSSGIGVGHNSTTIGQNTDAINDDARAAIGGGSSN